MNDDDLQLCSDCGNYCRRTLNMCPTCYPPLTEQPSFIPGVFSECVLQQKPLFEGGMDKGPRRPKPNPEQGELFSDGR